MHISEEEKIILKNICKNFVFTLKLADGTYIFGCFLGIYLKICLLFCGWAIGDKLDRFTVIWFCGYYPLDRGTAILSRQLGIL